ncbi:metal-dependent hydrolase [Halocatena pleomorpha]|uniref:Metal-dependent hydrolase n=1 Tax=Halocatena pleomorpha TaxID=1785090 RepID=A0A3P3RJH9_9EURY|nr:metal-dependent hydrolase [Halocatena pleomorpha]RRJ33661.1 metal-dependent hydrolase [Halocatena pleomorpha]
MWPWEHLAVGYLCYSLYSRVRTGSPPTEWATIALVVGTQFPDIVDKPLAWQFGLLPSGNSLAHSALVAGVSSALVLVVSHRRRVPQLGIAFVMGYLLHLPGDVLYPLVYGNGLWTEFLWWPFVSVGSGESFSVLSKVSHLLKRTGGFLMTPAGRAYLGGELGLLLSTIVVWWFDGRPGIGVVRTARTDTVKTS